jgi:hypothetical protein
MLRLRLYLAATALLYLGPVLAGWGGAPLAAWPVFAGIFLIWAFVMRPDDWPRSADAASAGRAAMSILVLTALALACLALGWLLAALVAPPIPLGAWPGVLLALLAVPLSRLVWNPAKARALDGILDDTIAQIRVAEAGGPAANLPGAPRPDLRQRAAEAEVMATIDFVPDTPPDRIASVMADLVSRFGPRRLIDGFATQFKGGRMNAAQRRALVMLATDPVHQGPLSGMDAQMLAFRASVPDAALLQLFASRYAPLLGDHPALVWDGPSNSALRAAEKQHVAAPATVAALRSLRARQIAIADAQRKAGTLAARDETP